MKVQRNKRAALEVNVHARYNYRRWWRKGHNTGAVTYIRIKHAPYSERWITQSPAVSIVVSQTVKILYATGAIKQATAVAKLMKGWVYWSVQGCWVYRNWMTAKFMSFLLIENRRPTAAWVNRYAAKLSAQLK